MVTKQQLRRTKPRVNVGTIGHLGHGKSTLAAAILATQSRKGLVSAGTSAEIIAGEAVNGKGKPVTFAASHVEYDSDQRHYTHFDWPGDACPWRIDNSSCKAGTSSRPAYRQEASFCQTMAIAKSCYAATSRGGEGRLSTIAKLGFC